MKAAAMARLLGACLLAGILLLSGRALRADGDDAPDGSARVLNETTVQVDAAALANLSVTAAAERPFPEILSVMGAISPVENRVSSVPARVAGRIDSVLKVTGEYVRAGDALALEYSPDFIQTRQEYLEALAKDRSMKNVGALENSDFSDMAASSRKKLENMGLIQADFDGLAAVGIDHTHLVIRAAHSGAITAVNTAVGNMQNQGDTLMTIAALDQVWFIGDLYSEDLTKVRPGQPIEIQTEGLSRPLEGTLSFISPVIDPNAHTIKIRALIANPDRELRAGMVVEGDIVLSRKTALVVPLSALMNLYGGWRCFKQVGPGRFQEVPVQEGEESGGEATVLKGLSPGDRVVSGGNLAMDYLFSTH